MTPWTGSYGELEVCPLCNKNEADFLCDCHKKVCYLCLYRGICFDCMGWLDGSKGGRQHLVAWLTVNCPYHLKNFEEKT